MTSQIYGPEMDVDLDYESLYSEITRQHYVLLRDLRSAEETNSLFEDAVSQHMTSSIDLTSTQCFLNGNRFMVPERRMRYADGGETLLDMHENPELVAAIRKITKLDLWPTRAGYVYYEPGDYLGTHIDLSGCQYTLLGSVAGPTEPLVVYPELAGTTSHELFDIVKAGGRAIPAADSREVEVPADGFLMFCGSQLPHGRPPVSKSVIIAALCYSGL